MRILMLVATDVTNDPRVMKEAVALSNAGHSVNVIGVCRSGKEPRSENVQGITIQRIDLWNRRLVRWLKEQRGKTITQSMFSTNIIQTPDSGFNLRFLIMNIVHQLQFVLDTLTVLVSFLFAGFNQRADAYYAHDVDMLLPAISFGMLFTRPVIYDAHEYWYEQRRTEIISNNLIRQIEKWGTPKCQHIFTVNSSIAELMAEKYKIPMPTVLMNVPANEPILPAMDFHATLPIQILYHGIYVPGRGLEQLIASLPLIKAPVHLTLRGYGELEPLLKEQVKKMGLDSLVTFAPPVPMRELSMAAMSSHVGIVPCTKEDFEFILPNKIFEYMAAGLALLTNDLVELRKIVIGHELGYVCDASKPDELAKAIDKFASNLEVLEQYRLRSWHVYRQRYTWDIHKHVLLDVFKQIT